MRRTPLMVLTVLALVVSACGEQATSPSSDTGGSEPAGSEPAGNGASGEVTIALPEEPTNLEPAKWEIDVVRVVKNVVEPLIDRAPTGELVPKLATDWEQVDDVTWRFTLREGVTYHNGEPFNAEAAAFGINRALDPAKEFSVAPVVVPMTASAVDEFTLEVTTEEPEAALPNLMYYLLLPEPGATGEEADLREPVGTGPYQVSAFEAGERIVLDAYAGYWGEAPSIATAEFVWRPDSVVRASMVEAGEADIAVEISSGDADESTIKSVVIPETPLYRLDPPCAALNDIRIWEAVDHAIDRQLLVDSLYEGFATPASHIITPDVAGYNEGIEVSEFDPELARSLVEEAAADGVPVDTEVTLMARPGFFPQSEELNEAVSNMLNEIGMNTTTLSLEANAWLEANVLKPVPPDRCMMVQSSHGNEVGDAVTTLRTFYLTTGTFFCCDETIDQMISDAATLTGDERYSAFQEVFEAAAGNFVEAPIPLFHLEALYSVSPELQWEPRFDRVIHVATMDLGG